MRQIDRLQIALLLKGEEDKWQAGLDLGDLVHPEHAMYMKGALEATQKALELILEIDSDNFIIKD